MFVSSPLVLLTTADTCWAGANSAGLPALCVPADADIVQVRLDQDGWADVAALDPAQVIVDLRHARNPRALLALVVRRHLPRAALLVVGPAADQPLRDQCARSATDVIAAEDVTESALVHWLQRTPGTAIAGERVAA